MMTILPYSGNLQKVLVLRWNSGLLNQIFYSVMLMCTTLKASMCLLAVVGGNQIKTSAAGPPSKPENYYRVNTFFTSLDKVLAKIENRFSGNDQDFICTLGDVTLSHSPASDSFDSVAGYCNFDKELHQADQCLFNRFKKHMSKNQ